jgi:hypothetical protein
MASPGELSGMPRAAEVDLASRHDQARGPWVLRIASCLSNGVPPATFQESDRSDDMRLMQCISGYTLDSLCSPTPWRRDAPPRS